MPSRTTTTKRHNSNTKAPSRRVAPNPIVERKRAAKAQNTKPLKQIFKGKHITSIGQFENCGRTLGPAQIQGYVENHGGTYENEVTSRTTHLICSIEDYKKKHPQVQAAWGLGKGKCSIVVFDWLLDCTVSTKKSCRAAGGYTLDRTIKRIQQGKKDHQAYRQRFQEGVRASKEMVDNRLWHIYYDYTGFEYKVMLTRINLGVHSDKPMVEKYTLYLFESHAVPHLYMCGAKLSRSHRPCAYYREQCHAMEFSDAFKHFQHFFKDKTGVEWDMRLEKQAPYNSNTANAANTSKQNGQVIPERRFTWLPPILGRPVGQLPLGYVRPEDREDAHTSSDSSGSGGSGSGSESSEGEGKNEDVVYDTDSDVESDNEKSADSEDEKVENRKMRTGISFAADLALARAMATNSKSN